jgi:beta-xylosidase
VAGAYYVWYSRTTRGPDGYSATVWWASSADGHAWVERGEALGGGPAGAFDEHAVFTPTVLVAGGRYYLVYTAVPEPFTNDGGGPGGTRTAIGVAAADSPAGPWARLGQEPILVPSDDPEQFDSHRVDDACIVVRQGQYWMYYKGRQLGRTPAETRMGLARSDSPAGPYAKWEGNPVLDSGHEVCVWPHGAGVGCLVSSTGPQGNTLQYSQDGLAFRRCGDAQSPKAPGPYRADHYLDGPGPGIAWGLCQHLDPEWPWLERFDGDLRCPGSLSV